MVLQKVACLALTQIAARGCGWASVSIAEYKGTRSRCKIGPLSYRLLRALARVLLMKLTRAKAMLACRTTLFLILMSLDYWRFLRLCLSL